MTARPWAVLALLSSCLLAPTAQAEGHRVFGIYALWFDGSNDEDREQIDRFLDCLVNGSNLNSYWQGEAGVELRGSWALPPPPRRLDWDELPSQWIGPQIGAPGGLPDPRSDETPLYLVFGGRPDLWTGACGRNAAVELAGREAGVGIVRVDPPCWPTGDPLRSETQIALHEIVETVDRTLGYGACAAGGACRGAAVCEDHCDTFVGLQCPGAPTGSWTGCSGGRVDGWVIQKLGYAGRDPDRCEACAPCDFTPTACAPDEPDCARVPPRPQGRRNAARLEWLAALVILGLLVASAWWLRRRRR